MDTFPESMNRRPRAFAPLDGLFWADPWIASHVLYAHLDGRSDDASRPLTVIGREVEWVASLAGANGPGTPGKVLDLGCGAGLHGLLFSQRGWQVTGIDLSPVAIEYARGETLDAGLAADYRAGNFLTGELPGSQDLVLLAYGTLGTLSPLQARSLVRRCRRALRPGGLLVLDAFRKPWWERQKLSVPTRAWDLVHADGFWAPGEHLVLTRMYAYPERRTFGRIYTVVEPAQVRQFPFWYRWYDPEHLVELLDGWSLRFAGSLSGSPLKSGSSWVAVAATRQE
jgi:SAM-dependent methyltransferase